MKNRLAVLVTGVLIAAGLSVALPQVASAASCAGTYRIVVPGFGHGSDAGGFYNFDQRVGYSAQLTSQSAREGVNELNRLVRDQRNVCPGQHVRMIGHSEGAAVVQIWVTENWQSFGNVNAVLLADPKRAPEGHGSGGLAGQPGTGIVGFPLVGVDNFFGNVPTVTICTDDIICDSTAPSGWLGYYPGTDHINYNFDANAYSDNGNGQWFYGQFFPR